MLESCQVYKLQFASSLYIKDDKQVRLTLYDGKKKKK